MILGIVTTVTGLAVLGYYTLTSTPNGSDPWLFTSHFVPRLTLVVFIEIFAYFFLRLYKSSLAEIKYFQNEMTNVESHFVALAAATTAGHDDACKEVIRALGEMERNHVLHKGQTTVELEKARLDKDVVSEFAQKVLEIVGKKA